MLFFRSAFPVRSFAGFLSPSILSQEQFKPGFQGRDFSFCLFLRVFSLHSLTLAFSVHFSAEFFCALFRSRFLPALICTVFFVRSLTGVFSVSFFAKILWCAFS